MNEPWKPVAEAACEADSAGSSIRAPSHPARRNVTTSHNDAEALA
jgi:hypothetical protein